MGLSGEGKRLRLRRADRCSVCSDQLDIGAEAIWHRDTRTVTCTACAGKVGQLFEGQPGASALREYNRRHQRREDHARQALGGPGVLLSRVIDEPSSTKVWRQGADGELRAGMRLAKHLTGSGVRLLHDRRITGHGHANIDHLAIGPGGVTVIDTNTHHGPIRVERVGGLFSPRRSVLLINGRDQTKLIDGSSGKSSTSAPRSRRLTQRRRTSAEPSASPTSTGYHSCASSPSGRSSSTGPSQSPNSPAARAHSATTTCTGSGRSSGVSFRPPNPASTRESARATS